jgi:alkylated DNA nucleotide flippase Atl1
VQIISDRYSQVLVTVLAQVPCGRVAGSTQLAAVVRTAHAGILAGLDVLELEPIARVLDVPL